MEIKVTEPVAKYFYIQCAGEYSGHMAPIPNNPTIHSLMKSHRVNSTSEVRAKWIGGW